MALYVANHDENSGESGPLVVTLSATLFSAVINLVIYLMSDASEVLSSIGRLVSDSTYRNELLKNQLRKSAQSDCCSTQHTLIFWLVITEGLILTNIAIRTVISLQEQQLLAERYIDLFTALDEQQKNFYSRLINNFVVKTGNLMGNYFEIAFQSSFAISFVQAAQGKITSFCQFFKQGGQSLSRQESKKIEMRKI